MASSSGVLMRLVASAYAIADKAGLIVRKVMAGGDLGIVEKCGANDLQTKADRLVQMSICSSLARKFPKVTIIAEEDLPSQELDEDLLEDGQCEEILKKACPQQYAAIKEEEAGADAVLGRTIWGVLGLGAFGFQLKEMPAGKHIITTTRSHSSKLVNDCVSAMNPDSVVRVGGAGNKIIQLVEGKASAYVFASPGCKKWDTCAPEAILHAVGGKLTDIHGNFFQYNKEVKHMNSGGVLAALRNHEYYASRVPEAVKQALVP
ncbi:3'(2'),5'-bisphosphate nucleotidase 1 isoform X3 [Varanus komodoensis]|uniref:3'(2'),5'-bisphosphate nucleotidase 1 isoform X3 n=1 Tax=Varanus komodoensis TaxID=61221 RepID=UPI001CF798D0|nr:3'(2'),5'-bisphosphate nucleotidase 1 isoform X3 [Varanus komodoensis]